MGYKFYEFEIPDYMMSGLERYVESGIAPGGFLSAVIENNLERAVSNADNVNRANIPAYVGYLYNEAPAGCWGYAGAVDEWCEKKTKERKEKV